MKKKLYSKEFQWRANSRKYNGPIIILFCRVSFLPDPTERFAYRIFYRKEHDINIW